LDLLPFFISQIGWIILRMRLHPLCLYGSTNAVQH
jgi:hypothetical protein